MNLTADRLRDVLRYDPATGIFVWVVLLSNKGPIGAAAGSTDKHGYINIGIDNKEYKAHRLAWLYVTSEWPKTGIDHRNGVPSDNRFINSCLRVSNIISGGTKHQKSHMLYI